jgi:hypothetical protein
VAGCSTVVEVETVSSDITGGAGIERHVLQSVQVCRIRWPWVDEPSQG